MLPTDPLLFVKRMVSLTKQPYMTEILNSLTKEKPVEPNYVKYRRKTIKEMTGLDVTSVTYVNANYQIVFIKDMDNQLFTSINHIPEQFRNWFEEVIDWSIVPVGTPIWVKGMVLGGGFLTDNDKFFPRYFAEYKDGNVYAWADGGLSNGNSTNEIESFEWKEAKLRKVKYVLKTPKEILGTKLDVTDFKVCYDGEKYGWYSEFPKTRDTEYKYEPLKHFYKEESI